MMGGDFKPEVTQPSQICGFYGLMATSKKIYTKVTSQTPVASAPPCSETLLIHITGDPPTLTDSFDSFFCGVIAPFL